MAKKRGHKRITAHPYHKHRFHQNMTKEYQHVMCDRKQNMLCTFREFVWGMAVGIIIGLMLARALA